MGLTAQHEFLKKAAHWPAAMAVAYPRFHDIYAEAKVHPTWGHIADNRGQTFVLTLEKALKSTLPLVQISTWNDWGEGTMIEPSQEFGYRDLEVVQRVRRQSIEAGFAGVPEDLRLPLRLYTLRKRARVQRRASTDLDRVSALLGNRACKPASAALDAIEKDLKTARP